MKPLFALFFIFVAVRSDVRVCNNIKCEPKDEFLNGETDEWNDFMDNLVKETFKTRSLSCVTNSSQIVTVDPSDDIVWDLRFKIYSERKIEGEKTLNDCYCDFTDCKSDEFRNCLAEARTAMKNDVQKVLVGVIGQYLADQMMKC
ncbi:uncharacterized protein LOC123008559 [Tribolium madens]|uniref:uncharacterized protein LOC123008559 n=1 Tax=Tribolium madens TaxID=41895 RepID=UPI001CF742FD|nr:uncharacterized protein LOC123008559 [Tribolium madens]